MPNQSSRELVRRTITFDSPNRLAYDLPPEFGSDFVYCPMSPFPEDKPSNGYDEWGVRWGNIGSSAFGEPQDIVINDWSDLSKIKIPDIESKDRWQGLAGIRQRYPEKFLVGYGQCIYDRAHYLRGLGNLWTDIYLNTEELEKLLYILVEMSLKTIKRYGQLEYDGYYFWDDWGLQANFFLTC